MEQKLQFLNVSFQNFKSFKSFDVPFRHFNILVGPNNSGKSTVLAAFRILAAAMRKASSRKAEIVRGPLGDTHGFRVDLRTISVAEENIFFNYDDSRAASVVFTLSNGHILTLYFPEQGSCTLLLENTGRPVTTPSAFKTQFNCSVGFVPILGPVEHREPLYDKEAARLALFNYRAARNFRNIWYHYGERLDEFRDILKQTWPGMDIERPVVEKIGDRPELYMFCPEERIPREIFWSGFGFQFWCQMLTHVIQSQDASLFLIDEPDIYLHAELQRQILSLLRLGPDILIATHSVEIVTEAEPDDILLINKRWRKARRVKQPSQVEGVFEALGSNLNPVLTQLAKTRRAVFVEGKDFQILTRFANKLGATGVSSRGEFAVVPVDGFNPERIRSLKAGMETTLGRDVTAAAIFDRDYRSVAECRSIAEGCEAFCSLVRMHGVKEIENFVLVPDAIDRAAERKVVERGRRGGASIPFRAESGQVLRDFAKDRKPYVASQYVTGRRRFAARNSPGVDEATVSEAALREFEASWEEPAVQLHLIPGKEALGAINRHLQARYGVTVTSTAIIDAMRTDEVPAEMKDLIQQLTVFTKTRVS